MVWIALFVAIPFLFYQYYRIAKEDKCLRESSSLHWDMYDKYRELLDDPCMTYLKWKEWLPIFEAADERCLKLSPHAKSLGRVSDFVKRVIDDDDYKKDQTAVR